MLKGINSTFKLLLSAIVIVPSLFVAGSYFLHANGAPSLVLAASNADALPCKAGSKPVDALQCATWSDATVDARMTVLPFLLFAAQVLIVILVAVALKKGSRLLLLSKMLLVTGAVVLAPMVAIATNMLAQPHSQQAIISVSKLDGEYKVDREPTLGFGPLNMGVYVLLSFVPALGLIGGAIGAAAKDHKKYAGMTKEALFQ